MRVCGGAWGDSTGRGGVRLLAAALVVAAVGAQGAFAVQPPRGEPARYIVQALPGQLAAAKSAVERIGGHVISPLGVINGFTASVRTGVVGVLRTRPSILAATADASVTLQGGEYAPIWDAGAPQATAQAVGADMYWQNGFYGQGVGVAILDSGVASVDGMRNNVFYGPDLTPEGSDKYLRNQDTFGHGTFMAGLIAGRSAGLSRPYLANYATTTYLGVAPEAKIISVKAADAIGQTYTSTIVQGIDWVVQHRADSGLNIRVLNLSLGLTNTGYKNDPVSAAAERAWAAGIVVVAAAGNDGTAGVLLPAADPYVIAAGALENQNTVSISDDAVASFSNKGTAERAPDLVASGTHLVGLRVPGSYIDQAYSSTGAVSPVFFRGSGTSQSAAVTSGAVALLLSQTPAATPDQVKSMLKSSARKLVGLTTSNSGSGGLYVAGTFGYPPPAVAPQSFTHAANWSTASANWTGGGWSAGTWTAQGAAAPTSGLSSARWTGTSWSGAHWTGANWTGANWTGAHWTGNSWSSAGWK